MQVNLVAFFYAQIKSVKREKNTGLKWAKLPKYVTIGCGICRLLSV